LETSEVGRVKFVLRGWWRRGALGEWWWSRCCWPSTLQVRVFVDLSVGVLQMFSGVIPYLKAARDVLCQVQLYARYSMRPLKSEIAASRSWVEDVGGIHSALGDLRSSWELPTSLASQVCRCFYRELLGGVASEAMLRA